MLLSGTRKFGIGLSVAGLLATATPVFSVDAHEAAAIDTDLRGQLDLRELQFEVCLDTPRCTVAGVTVTAERKRRNGQWTEALIYWDPIDGFGVLGGQQNDEIDVDERLTLTFNAPRVWSGVWLSDLFIGEGTRYQGWPESEEDVEIADLELRLDGDIVGQERISGIFELPDDPFNEEVNEIFVENGDLLNRVIVDGLGISVFVPDGEDAKGTVKPLGAIGDDKKAVFADTEIIDADLDDLLGDDEKLAVFDEGDDNAVQLVSIRTRMLELEKLRLEAEELRVVGDLSNGELGWRPEETVVVDQVVLTAGYKTSSDYSIAGLLFEAIEQ